MTRIKKRNFTNLSFYLSRRRRIQKIKYLDEILKYREIKILEKYTSVAPTKWDDESVNVSIEFQHKKIQKSLKINKCILRYHNSNIQVCSRKVC